MESSTAITEARSADAAIPGARTQDDWYAESMAHYGASLARLADSDTFKQLLSLIESLKPIDRQIILLYLEDFSAEAIGEVVGLSSENIATKIHRIKKLLARMNRDRGAQ